MSDFAVFGELLIDFTPARTEDGRPLFMEASCQCRILTRFTGVWPENNIRWCDAGGNAQYVDKLVSSA